MWTLALDVRPLYFAQKCPQNAGNAVSEPDPPTNVSSLFNDVTYFDPPKNPSGATASPWRTEKTNFRFTKCP